MAAQDNLVELIVGVQRAGEPFHWPDFVVRVRNIPRTTMYRIWVQKEDQDAAISYFKGLPGVRFVERAATGRMEEAGFSGGITDSWQKAIRASVLTRLGDGHGVVVAVVDSGVDLGNDSFESRVWRNSAEIPGDGVDNDGNGYVDDTHGWDFGDMDNDPMDELGHGTEVSSVILDLAPACTLLPLKINRDSKKTFGAGGVAEAIFYALDAGAKVINLSFSLPTFSEAVAEAIIAARDSGCVIVAAAGNTAHAVRFPANFAPVLAIGSVDIHNAPSQFSTRGRQLDLTAPGESVEVTLPGGERAAASGTSFSAPMVSGAAAVLRSMNPHLHAETIKYLLKSGARDLGEPGRDDEYGAGMLDGVGLWAVSVSRILLPEPVFYVYPERQPIQVAYHLPPTDVSSMVYVGMLDDEGLWWLAPDGVWHNATSEPVEPLASMGFSDAALDGIIMGEDGPLRAFDPASVGTGRYWWGIAITDMAGNLLGPVTWTSMIVH